MPLLNHYFKTLYAINLNYFECFIYIYSMLTVKLQYSYYFKTMLLLNVNFTIIL